MLFREFYERFELIGMRILFNRGNVCVTGLRGKGKDLLFGNIIARKKVPYISNLDYGGHFIRLDLPKLDIKNGHRNFIRGMVNKYVYPYDDNMDVYISDGGVYFPNYETSALNKEFQGLVDYMALSRQIGANNVHVNVQNLNRIWDKLREQSDIYIRCNRCFYLRGLVIQFITIYDQYDACVNRVKPFPRSSIFSKLDKTSIEMMKMNYEASHGKIQNRILIYHNLSKHDTRYFKSLLEYGGNVDV